MKPLLFAVLLLAVEPALAQTKKPTALHNVPVSTQMLLDGVKSPESRGVIKSVVQLVCPADQLKGTGFAVRGGTVIVTNVHVVGSCTADTLIGKSAAREGIIVFTGVLKDVDRDLALLLVADPLPFSLTLSDDERPAVETEVETWGYPLRYDDLAPILSRGYVAGYRQAVGTGTTGNPRAPVSRVIVNGALNPGNSGGPLIDRSNGKVVGVIVEKWNLYLPDLETVMQALPTGGGFGGGTEVYQTLPDGSRHAMSKNEEIALAINELYRYGQVVVGEAVAVSELNAVIAAHKSELPVAPE
jgi:S1-C subfamily serine protease